jgi:hypothetical protein
VEPVDRLDPGPGEFLTAVGQHPQRLELPVVGQHPKPVGTDRDHCDRVRVVGIGLPVVAGVKQPGPCRELGRHIDDMFTVGQQPLRQRPARAVAALDRPHPVRPWRYGLAHRGVPSLVGPEPASRQHGLVIVDDLDRRRQLVGIDPDEHLRHATTRLVRTSRDREAGIAVKSWAVPLEPRLGTANNSTQTDREPHPDAGGQPRGEHPVERLDRVWPDTGPTGIV